MVRTYIQTGPIGDDENSIGEKSDGENEGLFPTIDTNQNVDSYNIRIAHPTEDEPSDDEAISPSGEETGIPDVSDLGSQDTRYGGEDLSGMSEWSMRAKNLQLDDGLDAGDYKRPDNEIAANAVEAFKKQLTSPGELRFKVQGGELTIEGWIKSKDQFDSIETIALDIPGVKELHNFVEVSERRPG